MNRLLLSVCLALWGLVCVSCQTVRDFSPTQRQARMIMASEIAQEPLGDYFIGRRYFKEDYKMWGYVRRPRQAWSEARLVMLNEERVLAADRAINQIGADNGCEYRLLGRFSGEEVYEPAANQVYPEFVLERMELRSKAPGPIFADPRALDPRERYYPDPK